MAEETKEEATTTAADVAEAAETTESGQTLAQAVGAGVDAQAGNAAGTEAGKRGRRAEKIGVVSSDKMEKTCVVRVDRLVKHPKYRRYVRRTSKFMAHNEKGATTGDKVRIAETRPLSANKRWRVVEIIQKAEK
ncbi:MAG: small subunit ribosomal protein [Acidobacteriota bacterium]|jgi:small subunit ribosomal protein S17|nr:small subunit ribosomal protein [Acidobacteriota bacterium]